MLSIAYSRCDNHLDKVLVDRWRVPDLNSRVLAYGTSVWKAQESRP